VNSIFGRKTPGLAAERWYFSNEKGGPANEPAFFTGTVIANFSIGEPNQGDASPLLMNS
jgi:hypothetical protein